MPLLVFNHHDASQVLDRSSFKIVIPHMPTPSSLYTLKAVHALYFNEAREDFRMLEIELPSLMKDNKIIFDTRAEGTVAKPNDALRFYVNNMLGDGSGQDGAYKAISLQPNLSLGHHTLLTREFEIKVTARHGGGSRLPMAINSFSIVIEHSDI